MSSPNRSYLKPRRYRDEDSQKVACRHTALMPITVVDRAGFVDIVTAQCHNCKLFLEVPGMVVKGNEAR